MHKCTTVSSWPRGERLAFIQTDTVFELQGDGKMNTGFIQRFEEKIQGLFKDFQGPLLKFSRTIFGLFADIITTYITIFEIQLAYSQRVCFMLI
jgi:hypothetical protein